MTNEEEQEVVRSVFRAYINDLKAHSTKTDRPTFKMLEEVKDKVIKALEQKPCEDCVSRKLLSDNLCEGISCNECSFNEIDGESGCLLQKRFDELPPIQPTRPTGKWIEKEDYNLDTYYDCSECGESFCLIDGTPADNLYKYCPNCGAKMEVDDNAE